MDDGIGQRVKEANKVLAIVGKHGRQFFYSGAHDRMAKFGLDGYGVLRYMDHHTGMLVYPVNASEYWPGFTNGGTMKRFVARLAEYILTGERVEQHYFPIERDAAAWAYGEDVMRQVLAEAIAETDAIAPPDDPEPAPAERADAVA